MAEKEFNLLDEKWIRVLDMQGAPAEVSLFEIFEHAHLYKRLANETETLDVAMLRLLLAIMYAVFSSVDADGNIDWLTKNNALARWKSLWEMGKLPYGAIKDYLDCFHDMFYLFHPERPFYQVANLASRPCTEYKTPKLIGDISQSGNKARLFFSRTDSNRIESPEAARWLLHLNAFDDTSAKPSQRGGSMKSPGAGWLGKLGLVFSEGHNLFQTLLLNFVLLNADGEPFKRGTPVWELDAPRSEERVEIPQIPRDGSLAELYTMQSRRLLLTRDGGMITGYKLLGGDFFARENAFIEQMTLWRRDKKTEDFTPMRHSSDKQLWRDFSALTLKDEGSMIPGVVQWHVKLSNEGLLNGPKGTSDNIKVKFSTPSMGYGDKYFFVDDLYSDSLSINLRLLDDLRSEWRIRISDALKATGTAVWHFGNFTLNLAIAEGADPKGNNTAQIKATAQEEAYGQLDIPFREWLSSLTGNEDLDETVNEWMHMAKKILRGLATEKFNSVSDAALIGRPNDPQDLSKGFMTAFTAETIFYSGLKKSLS